MAVRENSAIASFPPMLFSLSPVAMDLEIYTVQSALLARLIKWAGAHAEGGGNSHTGEGYLDLNFIFTLMEKRAFLQYIHTSQKMRKFIGLAKKSISANIDPPEVAGGKLL